MNNDEDKKINEVNEEDSSLTPEYFEEYLPDEVDMKHNHFEEENYQDEITSLRHRQEMMRMKKANDLRFRNYQKKDVEDEENKEEKEKQETVKKKVNQAKKVYTNIQKENVKAQGKKMLVKFIAKYWWLLGGIAILLLLFIIILGIFLGGSEYDSTYIDRRYDFNDSTIVLTNNYENEEDRVIIDERLDFDTFIKGVVYARLYNNLEGLTDSEKLELFKTYIVTFKPIALLLGGYDYESKELNIKSADNEYDMLNRKNLRDENKMAYCDIHSGCSVIVENGLSTYYPGEYLKQSSMYAIREIPAMSDDDISLINKAYSQTEYILVMPSGFKTKLENASQITDVPHYNDNEFKTHIIEQVQEGKKYDEVVEYLKDYTKFSMYDIVDYITVYNYGSSNSWWWPIGSKDADQRGLYSGEPASLTITSNFSPARTIGGKTSAHTGLDIGGICGETPVIASRGGKVVGINDSCDNNGYFGNTCGGHGGNFVKIMHDDGTITYYGHLYPNSITISLNDEVAQGQKIGEIGKSGSATGCHLHFEVRLNGKTPVNPLDYISAENPRPTSIKISGAVKGNSNLQTVCLTLKESGFNNKAVAAILTNMESESNHSWDPTVVGDHGTSIGLCQWHNERKERLKEYGKQNCHGNHLTAECQTLYLINELSGYGTLMSYFEGNNTALDMTREFCNQFERPAGRPETCIRRANSSYTLQYLEYAENNCQ